LGGSSRAADTDDEDEEPSEPDGSTADFLRGTDDDDRVETIVEVWPELWHGVSGSEIRAVCLLMRIARVNWPDVLDGVQFMAQVVAKHRNDEQAKNAKK
jgi:hypothetical protein